MAFRILTIDDSATMRSVIKKIIRLSGLDVDTYFEACNGKEALEILSSNWIDVLLVDINMPVMDGIEFLKSMNQDDLARTIPVVMVTTEGRGPKVEEALKLGARAHVKKPFRPEEIKQVLMNVMGVDDAGKIQEELEGCDF
ncbi:MAG: response regulator [Deltaproteobacteria bacterium]|nr:response regulator [Deltaproteobacteria bacterium]